MSQQRLVKYFFALCMGFFALHFTMTLLHNVPEKYLSPRMESYSHLWCYPTFHQGWALFAPDPQPKHKRMEMRYHTDAGWTEWYRAERICVGQHENYRVTHYSKLCHLTQNIIYHLWLDVDLFNGQDRPEEEYYSRSMGYGIACNYADKQAFHYEEDLDYDSLEIKLILEDPFEKISPEVIGFPKKKIDHSDAE